MRRSTGAIFLDSRPATIIRSDCRGEPRKTSAPKRAMSYRDVLIAIISMAQQASPKVTGQIDDRRAHWTIFSTVVVSTGISKWSDMQLHHSVTRGCRHAAVARRHEPASAILMSPVEHALAPDVDVARQEQQEEANQLEEPGPAQLAHGERPWIEKGDLDVEEEEDHRDQVELHRVPIARVA